jgi:hypothetical protein
MSTIRTISVVRIGFQGGPTPSLKNIRASLADIQTVVWKEFESSDGVGLERIRLVSVKKGIVVYELMLQDFSDDVDDLVSALETIDDDGNYPINIGRYEYLLTSEVVSIKQTKITNWSSK